MGIPQQLDSKINETPFFWGSQYVANRFFWMVIMMAPKRESAKHLILVGDFKGVRSYPGDILGFQVSYANDSKN